MTRSRQLRLAIAVLAVLPLSLVPAHSQDSVPAKAKDKDSICKGVEVEKDENGNDKRKPHACNGISVGAPKVFDNRALTLMLEALSQTLHSQQQSFIDQKSVLGALSNLQGFSQTDSSTNLSITGSPTPTTDVKTALNTGNVDATGNPLPNTFQRQTDVSRASVTPQAPALDTFSAVPGFNPNFGSSASDLLNDQVNLTYQIFNLQMILERSLSDRLLPNETGSDKTRLQAVLGFNVTIDPPRTANDAVAVVEITLTSTDGKPLSLVSLMPQEKTYNSAALSNKSNAFGGAAAVSAFQIGFSARKRSQIFYLYRDTDTLSYERMTGDAKTVVFGWMFRPVLGRRSISPGLRQLFAIMALPNVDCLSTGDTEDAKDKDGKAIGSSHPCKANLKSEVRTYWKKYDRATLTSFEHGDANRASHFWYGLSMGLSRPQIFEDHRYENAASYDFPVESSATYQKHLEPTVESVSWRPIGTKNVIVSVKGNNFFTNTQVAMGDKIYAKLEDGLILKSNQGFDLTLPVDALANGPGTIIGRYGLGIPLIKSSDLPPGFGENGVEIVSSSIHPSLGGRHRIDIQLQGIASDEAAQKEGAAGQVLSEAKTKLASVKEHMAAIEKATQPLPSTKSRPEAQGIRNNLTAITAQYGDYRTLQAQSEALTAQVASATEEFKKAEEEVLKFSRSNGLQDLDHYSPVISVNGKSLELPYHRSIGKGGVTELQADVPDASLADGGGLVKVSWPFYPAGKWTVSAPFYDPDKAFEVTRVSQKSILIHRIDGFSFTRGPENTDESTCWRLIVGDEELPLIGKSCPAKPSTTSGECKKKKKTDPCAPPPPPPIAGSDYVATASVDSLPDKVVLVAPSGSIYNLAVPALKPKDDKVAPIELKQYDSLWIEIKAEELTTDAASKSKSTTAKKDPPLDLNKVASVEANGKPVHYVKDKDKTADAKAAADKKKAPLPLKTIKVEITRELTSKPGTIDIAFQTEDKQLLGTRQLHITQTDWSNKGEK